MANRKITELTALTGANATDTDVFAIVDVSADETKKMTLGELKEAFDSGSGFVRITGDTMTGDLSFGDNDKAIFGAGSDLQIYHDGSDSIINDAGTGNLFIRGTSTIILGGVTSNNVLINDGADVKLRYNSADKLATTSTGIDVTGTVTADGLTVDTTNGGILKFTNTDTTLVDNQVVGRIEFEGADGSGAGGGTKGSITLASADAQGFSYDMNFGVSDTSNNDVTRLTIGTEGDISFYEDTGTTAKLHWSASAESLGIGTTPSKGDLDVASSSTAKIVAYSLSANSADSGRVEVAELADFGGGIRYNGSANTAHLYGFNPSTHDVLSWGRAGDFITFSTTDTERMRIDSSGNLLVGKTANNTLATAGANISADGWVQLTATSRPLMLNRLNSDGNILEFFKDVSLVGSITATNGDLSIGTGDAALRFHDGANRIEPYNVSTNTNTNGTVDLGVANARFKDLYLSGGVYLGGTGSANKLDDYEEGTWTPVIYGSSSAGTMGGPSTQGKYTKVGNQVTCWCYINSATLSGASGDLGVSGLPFTATITNPAVSISSAMRNNLSLPTNGTTAFFVLVNGSNSGTFRVSYTNNTNSTLLPTTSIGSSCSAAFSITYTTAS